MQYSQIAYHDLDLSHNCTAWAVLCNSLFYLEWRNHALFQNLYFGWSGANVFATSTMSHLQYLLCRKCQQIEQSLKCNSRGPCVAYFPPVWSRVVEYKNCWTKQQYNLLDQTSISVLFEHILLRCSQDRRKHIAYSPNLFSMIPENMTLKTVMYQLISYCLVGRYQRFPV